MTMHSKWMMVIPALALALTSGCGSQDDGGDGLFGDASGGTSAGTGGDDSGGDASGDDSGDDSSGDSMGDGDGDGDSDGDGDGDGDGDDGILFDVGDGGEGDGGGDGGMPGDGCKFIDLLFVVDISASMSEEKANLAANFPTFVQVMDDYVANSEALGYRLGTTNSTFLSNAEGEATFGLDGKLFDGDDGFPACGTGGALWVDGPAAGISDTFVCLGNRPKSDCSSCSDIGKERPLDAIEAFIGHAAPGGYNDGFYRGEESLLVVVILTDEDDDVNNTTTTPAQTKAALDEFVGGAERHVVVTIAGPQSGGCSSAFGDAAAAPILHEFNSLMPNGVLGDICQGDLTQALEDALAEIQISCDELPAPVG